MSNVVRLREAQSHAPVPFMASSLAAAETITCIRMMHSMAKSRLDATLSLLDMTFANIRQLNAMISDPDVKAVVEGELATLESALSTARVRARQL